MPDLSGRTHSWLDWEPPQNSLLTHALWRWTGGLVLDALRWLVRR